MGEIMKRGVFDVTEKKKEEKPEVVEMPDMIQFDPEPINEEANNKKSDELQRTRSHLSLSSDEEIGEGGERKKKKKKGLKEKMEDSIKNGHPNEDEKEQKMDYEDTPVTDPVANFEEISTNPVEEKKGFLDKIKEILPGQHKKSEEDETKVECNDDKEKKSLMEKIKEKLPGGQKNHEENAKEKCI